MILESVVSTGANSLVRFAWGGYSSLSVTGLTLNGVSYGAVAGGAKQNLRLVEFVKDGKVDTFTITGFTTTGTNIIRDAILFDL